MADPVMLKSKPSRPWFRRWFCWSIRSARFAEAHRASHRGTLELRRRIARQIAERLGNPVPSQPEGSSL